MAFAKDIAEIADSDEDEIYYLPVAPASRTKPNSSLQNGSTPTPHIPQIELDVNFSDFLSQTYGPNTQTSNSTQPEVRMNSSKRSHSEMVRPGRREGSPPGKRSRQKTYASNRCLRSSQSDLFLEQQPEQPGRDLDATEGSYTLESDALGDASPRQQDSQNDHIQSMEAEGGVDDLDLLLPQYAVGGGPSLENGSVNNTITYHAHSASNHTTTRSLVGSYEPINLDFGRDGIGSDLIANPFGDPEHGLGPTQLPHGHFFSPDQLQESALPQLDGIDGNDSWGRSIDNGNTVDPREASTRSKSYVDPAQLVRGGSDAVTSPSGNSVNAANSRKRRKTEDLVSSVSVKDGLERATQPKKRGRKSKSQLVDTESAAAIDETHQVAARKTPQKDPMPATSSSSDLHLDDEGVIGLPKETYNPRPSRSRSKRVADESMPPPSQTPIEQTASPEKPPATASVDENAEIAELEAIPLTKVKHDKRRKNKVKRAKTSAAALLGKSNKMLSDGEEDVVWLEERPAAVKMTVPNPLEVKGEQKGYLEAAKQEQTDCNGDNAVQSPEKQRDETPARDNRVSVIIPPSKHVDDAPPKKRGRKSKVAANSPETREEATATPEPAPEPPSTASKSKQKRQPSRPPLQEMDTNTNNNEKPPVSNPNEGTKPASQAKETTAETQPTTPEKAEEPASAAATSKRPQTEILKGPTAHSPINPSGGRIKYRVGLSRRAAIPPLLKIVRK